MNIGETLLNLWNSSGFAAMFQGDTWKCAVMLVIGCVLL